MQVTNNRSLDRVVKIGSCEAGMCNGQAVAEVSIDTLQFDPDTLEARAIPKSVKVCMPHKSLYFRYQEGLMDRINPERKKNGKKGSQVTRSQTNMDNTSPIAQRFRALSS